jgi:predicted ribosome quality control (RQC) complex YloA/Tae2 family protein
MNKLEELKAAIVEKKREIDTFELDVDDYEDQYCECLDEEGPVKVAGLTFDVSTIIRELDPTAYRCGLNDYVDSIEKEETEEYKKLEEELEELESELSDIKEELEEN